MGANVRKVLILVALVLAVQSWATCTSYNYNSSGFNTEVWQKFTWGCPNSSPDRAWCESKIGTATPNSSTETSRGYCIINGLMSSNGSFCSQNNTFCRYYGECCTTKCERDSLVCVRSGKNWVDNPNAECGKSCLENGCTAQDTANINAQKSRCDSLGGTNDFALVNNGAQGCGLSGFCNLCNGTAYQNLRKQQQKDCCEQGHAPDTTKLKCSVESITSTDKRFVVAGQNSCLSGDPQIIITPDGESYREGCDDPNPPANSSGSTGNSSSSESGTTSSSSGTGVGNLEWLKDSTHKIIKYDSTTASNTIDLVNYLYDIKTCLESGTCGAGAPVDYSDSLHAIKDTIHRSNELLKQIADKDLSVQVNGGLTAEKQAELVASIGNVADSAAKYGEINGERLDSIISALKGIGADSVAHRLDSVRNEYIREGIDSLYSLRTGLDSTFADWSDTSGAAAAGDTTGKGGELDALGDSLANALWGYPCDTTGGKSCNTAYIGANGIANARNGWKGAADALGDSLNGGAIKDSVNSWTNKIVNNGVLSGNGAATCPAVFNRTWQVPLGTGITYTFGPFGKIVCYDFFGGITFWALARIVLRAMVAITCMWWLYHAVTGTTARGDDDED